jgi:uncharacterized protein (TIGR03437 family)
MKIPVVLLIPVVSAFAGAFAQTPAFGPPLSLPAQQGPLAITSADFNGDGLPDIAIANTGAGTVSIFLGTGGGKFSSAPTVSLRSQCSAAYLTAANFTGASAPDLLAVCALGGIVVLPNTGHGTFGLPLATNPPLPAWVGNLLLGSIHPAIADFNGDGHLDIAIPTFDFSLTSGGWFLLLGKGDGSFESPTTVPFTGAVPLSLAAADFNGDGKPDLVTLAANSDGTAASLEFAAGNGDGTFLAPTSVNAPLTIGSFILVADVNGDGLLDVVCAGSSLFTDFSALTNPGDLGQSAVTVFLGDGKGGFTMSFNATEPSYMTEAALANVLGTGRLDLIQSMVQGDVVSGSTPTGAIEIRPGNGDGTFANPITLSVSSSIIATDLATADFNGDGRPDIAIAALPAVGLSLRSIVFSSALASTLASALAELQPGDADVLLNTTVAPTLTFSDANAASFAAGPIANGSIVSAFGSGLAESIASASSVPLPTQLGGATITIQDSSGVSLPAPLFYASPTQINYAIPEATAVGPATITIRSGGSVFVAMQQIASVAPGIFAANGFANGFSDRIVNGAQQLTPLIQNGALVPVDVSGGQTYLLLYGTGIRNHANPVTATVGGAHITAAYAGAQGVYVGEDQINIQLPASLQGAGTVALSLLVDGQSSNSVQVLIK